MHEQVPQESSSWLQRHKLQVAAVAAGLVALVAPEIGHNTFDSTSEHPAVTTVEPGTHPTLEEALSYDQAYNDAGAEFVQSGYGAVVTPPGAGDKTFYFDGYIEQNNNDLPYSNTPVPRLHEVANIVDAQAFPQNVNYNWGFAVYNTTNEPIDTPFIRYETEFLQQWMASRTKAGITIDGSMTAQVSTNDVDHTIMLVNELPPSAKDQHITGAFTSYGDSNSNSNTLSWVVWGNHLPLVASDQAMFGKTNEGFLGYLNLATEICQSDVYVSDVQTVIGMTATAAALQQWINGVSYDNYHDLELTAQEIVCNSLGRALATYWLYGDAGLSQAEAFNMVNDQVGFPGTSTYDYGLAITDIGAMAAIKQRVKANPGSLYTIAGGKTPTTQADR